MADLAGSKQDAPRRGRRRRELVGVVAGWGRRLSRRYALACAREDAHRHGFIVPDGLPSDAT